jgi:hypothetical protein
LTLTEDTLIVASQSDSAVRLESDVPLVACFTGDAASVLDDWSSRGLHVSWQRLRDNEHVAWPCPCFECSPDGVVVKVAPKGPTSYEVAACVFAHARRGVAITDTEARELLLADTEPS